MRLFASRYFEVTVDAPRRLAVFRRSDVPFDTLEAMDAAFDELNAALGALDRATLALLVDSRDAPARNDPEYERAFEPHRRRMLRGFARIAILVKTASGRLQSQRLTSGDGVDAQTFTDEAAAMGFLGVR